MGKSIKARDWQDLYYDGEIDYYDERYVSPEMKEGVDDCLEYINSNHIDYDIKWFKNAYLLSANKY